MLVVDSASPRISFGVRGDPVAELAGLQRVVEDEDRGALHVVLDHRRLHAAALGQQPHAAVVAGDQGAFGGRHRDEEVALGVLAVDLQRPGDAERHLRDPGEVLDVAGQRRRGRTSRSRRGAGRRRSRSRTNVAAGLGRGRRVVVLRVAGDALTGGWGRVGHARPSALHLRGGGPTFGCRIEPWRPALLPRSQSDDCCGGLLRHGHAGSHVAEDRADATVESSAAEDDAVRSSIDMTLHVTQTPAHAPSAPGPRLPARDRGPGPVRMRLGHVPR